MAMTKERFDEIAAKAAVRRAAREEAARVAAQHVSEGTKADFFTAYYRVDDLIEAALRENPITDDQAKLIEKSS
jgi:hypothetical protein